MPDSFSMEPKHTPPVCDYQGSDYQAVFWDQGNRAYEDGVEAIALRRLLPDQGRFLLELGAGAGRNTPRYAGFERVVLLDYSTTQLEQAQQKLGASDRYLFVAADIYHLPFIDGLFDCATMIRTLHHMAEAPRALDQVRNVLGPGAAFVLEYANKLNLKAIARYWLGRQSWSPFSPEPVEFLELNFNFHPKTVRRWLGELGFKIDKILTVSHFRLDLAKKWVPLRLLIAIDALLQWTGALWQLTPSVFLRAVLREGNLRSIPEDVLHWFKCPHCSQSPLERRSDRLLCGGCGRQWSFQEGIYDFREPLPE